jgi:hypothetical protein
MSSTPSEDGYLSMQPSLAKRASRAFARFVITFGIGVGATLAWQSYGDAAREMIASASPQLAWLTPHAASGAQTAAYMAAPATPAAPSADQQQLDAVLQGLAAVRQSVDQLAAGQEQMTHNIAKMQAAEQGILNKISAPSPTVAAARKPVPTSSQAPLVR